MILLYNRTAQKDIRRKLRKNEPATERLMWSKLRNRQIYNFKFRRQYGIKNIVLDFYCSEAGLPIEIDGDSHYIDKNMQKDKERDSYLESIKVRVLRFTNKDVMENIEGVLQVIDNYLKPPTLSL